MSKKSRKRNRLILAALAAGTLAANRKKKGAVSTANQPVGVDRRSTSAPPIGGTDHISKVVVPKAKAIVDTAPVNKNTFRTRQRITDSAGNTIASAGVRPDKMPNTPPPSIGDPYSTRTGTGARRFGTVNYRKDGGRATYKSGGAAKRGVSPILLKGKK